MKENPARAGRRKLQLLITAIVPAPLPRPVGMDGLEITQPDSSEAGAGQGRGLGSSSVISGLTPGDADGAKGAQCIPPAHGGTLCLG